MTNRNVLCVVQDPSRDTFGITDAKYNVDKLEYEISTFGHVNGEETKNYIIKCLIAEYCFINISTIIRDNNNGDNYQGVIPKNINDILNCLDHLKNDVMCNYQHESFTFPLIGHFADHTYEHYIINKLFANDREFLYCSLTSLNAYIYDKQSILEKQPFYQIKFAYNSSVDNEMLQNENMNEIDRLQEKMPCIVKSSTYISNKLKDNEYFTSKFQIKEIVDLPIYSSKVSFYILEKKETWTKAASRNTINNTNAND